VAFDAVNICDAGAAAVAAVLEQSSWTAGTVVRLAHKWSKELDYRLIGELWAFTDNRIAVRFTSEYHDTGDAWFRASGGGHWEFDLDGLIRRRYRSVNECPIAETERMFLWPLGPRPHDHPELSHFDL
jgi:uncharacterized protein